MSFSLRSKALQSSTSRSFEPTSIPSPIPVLGGGTIGRHGLIDTSVAIALATVDRERLPAVVSVSALTIAELVGGVLGIEQGLRRMRRERHLQHVYASVEPLDFDLHCARAYGRIYEMTARVGRKPRGARAVDLMIAATAFAHRLPFYTLNAKDLRGLGQLIEIVDVGA